MATMYQRIEQLCLQHGTNITAMCRALGISRSALTELKAGRSKSLSYQTVSAIAAYFGVTTEYVAGSSESPLPQPLDDNLAEYLEELRTRPEMRMFFDLARGATKQEVETAVRIAEAYLKSSKEDPPDE